MPALAVGGYGVVSVTAHVMQRNQKMIDSYLNGNIDEAVKIHLKLIDITEKVYDSKSIPIKAALNILGINVGQTRLPLAAPSEDVINALKGSLTELGLISEVKQ